MSDLPFMQLWVDNLIGDTTGLSAEEFGALVLILITLWRNKAAPLPDDPKRLCRITRLDRGRWKKVHPAIAPYFTIDERGWSQDRLTREYERALAIRESRQESGRRGGQAKALKTRKTHLANAVDLLSADDKQNRSSQSQKSEDSRSTSIDVERRDGLAPLDVKDVLFTICLRWLESRSGRKGDHRGLIGKWIKNFGESATLAAFIRAQKENPFDPIPWMVKSLEANRHERRNTPEARDEQTRATRAAILRALAGELDPGAEPARQPDVRRLITSGDGG